MIYRRITRVTEVDQPTIPGLPKHWSQQPSFGQTGFNNQPQTFGPFLKRKRTVDSWEELSLSEQVRNFKRVRVLSNIKKTRRAGFAFWEEKPLWPTTEIKGVATSGWDGKAKANLNSNSNSNAGNDAGFMNFGAESERTILSGATFYSLAEARVLDQRPGIDDGFLNSNADGERTVLSGATSDFLAEAEPLAWELEPIDNQDLEIDDYYMGGGEIFHHPINWDKQFDRRPGVDDGFRNSGAAGERTILSDATFFLSAEAKLLNQRPGIEDDIRRFLAGSTLPSSFALSSPAGGETIGKRHLFTHTGVGIAEFEAAAHACSRLARVQEFGRGEVCLDEPPNSLDLELPPKVDYWYWIPTRGEGSFGELCTSIRIGRVE